MFYNTHIKSVFNSWCPYVCETSHCLSQAFSLSGLSLCRLSRSLCCESRVPLPSLLALLTLLLIFSFRGCLIGNPVLSSVFCSPQSVFTRIWFLAFATNFDSSPALALYLVFKYIAVWRLNYYFYSPKLAQLHSHYIIYAFPLLFCHS